MPNDAAVSHVRPFGVGCRYETNLLNTAAQAMELIEGKVQHPNVYVHLDSYHMNIEESRWGHTYRLLQFK